MLLLETMRDLAIIVLAIFALFQVVILLILSILIYKKLAPVLDNIRVATNSLKGTTSFMSETVVRPVISVLGFAVGARRTLSVLTGLKNRKGGR